VDEPETGVLADWDVEQDAQRAQQAQRDARRVRVQLRWVVGLVALAAAAVGSALWMGPVAGAAGGCGGG
jgi:fatty acid desaturase